MSFQPMPGQTMPQNYYDLMLSLSDLGARERAIKDQMMLADQIRARPGPGLIDAGRIKVAASPLEHLGDAVSRGLATRQRVQGVQQQSDLAAEIRRRIQEERNRQRATMSAMPTPAGQGTPMPVFNGDMTEE